MSTTIDQPTEMQLKTPTAMDLLSVALHNNAAIDVIERLAALQEKAMAREAEIGFNEAINRVQEQIKRIAPDLDNSQTKSKYASYAAIDRVIRSVYSKEGLSLSFDTADCPLQEHIRVVCYVSLRAHTRKYQIDMPCDGKGAKGGDVMTKTHAAGAAMAYGMRYLVKGIFNIAVGAEDADGNTGSLDAGHIEEQCEWITNAKNLGELRNLFERAYKEASEVGDKQAMANYIRTKDARKKELQ